MFVYLAYETNTEVFEQVLELVKKKRLKIKIEK